MVVRELTREQMVQLKGDYLCSREEQPSWGELAFADRLVPDEVIFEHYGHINFVEEDFAC